MKIIIGALFFLMSINAFSQELNCQVSIILDAKLEITTVEREALDELENVIYELMNNTAWTKEEFKVEERINCNLQLQIKRFQVKVRIKEPFRYNLRDRH